jgi:hydrogenase-4 component F
MMTTILLTAPVAVPVLAAGGYAAFGWRRGTAWLAPAAAAGVLAAAVCLAFLAVGRPRTGLGGLLRADALTALMLIVIGAVALLAMLASPSYLAAERAAGRTTPADARRYGLLTQGFIASMALAVLASSGSRWRRPRSSPRSSSGTAAPATPSRPRGSTW